jgi:hypothetical protein
LNIRHFTAFHILAVLTYPIVLDFSITSATRTQLNWLFHPGSAHRPSSICIFHATDDIKRGAGWGCAMLIFLHKQATTTPKSQASSEPARLQVKTDPQIIYNLTPRKLACQRDPNRILAEFIRFACAHVSSPLLHIT